MLTAEQERLCLLYNPFQEDDSDTRQLSDKIVTVRKGGDCCICFETIRLGEHSRKQTAIVDGRIASCRMCEECCAAMALSWADGGKAIEQRTSNGIEHAMAQRITRGRTP